LFPGTDQWGFYLRKSVKACPLRFNLSSLASACLAGVKGLRIGAGPRRNYIHMGPANQFGTTRLIDASQPKRKWPNPTS
jgi:hypothetical protein